MSLTKKRWIILVASCLVNLCIGSLYAWSVFATPMAAYLSAQQGLTGAAALTAGNLAIVFTLANGVGPITMISGGYINDRIGPRWVIFFGGLLFGAGMILSGFARNIAMLKIGYGLCCGLGMGMTYGCTIGNSVKFFPDKRGLIGGIATAVYGLSSVAVPPIANGLIQAFGVAAAFKGLGGAFLLIICISSFFIEKCPEGFMPDGYEAPDAGQIPSREQLADEQANVEKNWKQMLADPIFYVMILLLTCGAFTGMMVISQASAIAQNMEGLSVSAAAAVVSVLALFNAAGRVAAGFLSDKIGRINTILLAVCLELAGIGSLYLAADGQRILFYMGICITGICFGSFMGVFPGFTADQFGAKNNTVNYGIMFVGFAAAGLFGPMIISRIYGVTGSYKMAFLLALGLDLAGLALAVLYKKMKK